MTRQIKLDINQIRVQRIISELELDNIELYSYDGYFRGIILGMKQEILSFKHRTNHDHHEVFTNTITRPRFSNPWEHFKARYAGRVWMRWYVKRKPVQFIEEKYFVRLDMDFNFDELVTFPDNKYVFPKGLGDPVVVVQEKDRRISWSGPVDRSGPLV